MNTAGLFLVLGLTLATGDTSVDEHLLAGARSFRAGNFELALVEFRVAQRLGSRDGAEYAAAALVKLGRSEEAVETFDGTEKPGRDALLDYFHALACYGARLYHCSNRLLAGIGERSGPRIGSQAKELQKRITVELSQEPSTSTIDWYVTACSARLDGGRPILARAYCKEAAAHAERRKDPHRRSEIDLLLARLKNVETAGRQP